MSQTKSEDFLTQERDAKFKAWLQKKALRDKAFEVTKRSDLEALYHIKPPLISLFSSQTLFCKFSTK
jgi:hypothetical protein